MRQMRRGPFAKLATTPSPSAFDEINLMIVPATDKGASAPLFASPENFDNLDQPAARSPSEPGAHFQRTRQASQRSMFFVASALRVEARYPGQLRASAQHLPPEGERTGSYTPTKVRRDRWHKSQMLVWRLDDVIWPSGGLSRPAPSINPAEAFTLPSGPKSGQR